MGMATQLLEYTGNQFVAELSNVVVYICLAAAILSIVYAVYIAYLFFTASDQNKRKAAKDRLIKTLASCLIIFTAAAILKGLDITFNGVSGGYDGPTASLNEVHIFYNGEPTSSFDYQIGEEGQPYRWKITGKISLDLIWNKISAKTLTEKKQDNKSVLAWVEKSVTLSGDTSAQHKDSLHYDGVLGATIIDPGFCGTFYKYKLQTDVETTSSSLKYFVYTITGTDEQPQKLMKLLQANGQHQLCYQKMVRMVQTVSIVQQ